MLLFTTIEFIVELFFSIQFVDYAPLVTGKHHFRNSDSVLHPVQLYLSHTLNLASFQRLFFIT